VKLYLLPLFLLAACDQDQQNQRPGADRNDSELQRGTRDADRDANRPVGVPRDQDDDRLTRPADGTVGTNPDGSVVNPGANNTVTGQTDNPPFQQSEKPEDIRLTADIRKAVLAADGLSMAADNIQIITRDGVVQLRGNVESQAEKDTIEKLAHGVGGVVRIDNQLTVQSAQ
jgi:hypothetical protein